MYLIITHTFAFPFVFNNSWFPFDSRKSLLHEIKATKDVLMSSLKNVQDLELESRRVPQLEARIDDLEKLLPSERSVYNHTVWKLDSFTLPIIVTSDIGHLFFYYNNSTQNKHVRNTKNFIGLHINLENK